MPQTKSRWRPFWPGASGFSTSFRWSSPSCPPIGRRLLPASRTSSKSTPQPGGRPIFSSQPAAVAAEAALRFLFPDPKGRRPHADPRVSRPVPRRAQRARVRPRARAFLGGAPLRREGRSLLDRIRARDFRLERSPRHALEGLLAAAGRLREDVRRCRCGVGAVGRCGRDVARRAQALVLPQVARPAHGDRHRGTGSQFPARDRAAGRHVRVRGPALYATGRWGRAAGFGGRARRHPARRPHRRDRRFRHRALRGHPAHRGSSISTGRCR